eukprot:scaffold245595_cov43-Attheya_sp.AAC.1
MHSQGAGTILGGNGVIYAVDECNASRLVLTLGTASFLLELVIHMGVHLVEQQGTILGGDGVVDGVVGCNTTGLVLWGGVGSIAFFAWCCFTCCWTSTRRTTSLRP